MLHRLLRPAHARHVSADARRLMFSHGPDALFILRRAVLKARKAGGEAYWTQVLAEVEDRLAYRPW